MSLITLASDTLARLYGEPSGFITEQRYLCWDLLQQIHQCCPAIGVKVMVAPATLDSILSDLSAAKRASILWQLQQSGVEIPPRYQYKKGRALASEKLAAAELEFAIVHRVSALITYKPYRYVGGDRAVSIWTVEQLLEHIAQEFSTSAKTAENASESNQEAATSPAILAAVGAIVRHLTRRISAKFQRIDYSKTSDKLILLTLSKSAFQRRTIEFHAPTTSRLNSNAALNAHENTIKQAAANTFNNANDGKLNQLANQGGQFSGLWLLSQISKNDNRSDSPFETVQRSPAPTPSSLVRNYDLSTSMNSQNTKSQHSGSPDRASPEWVESDDDRAIFIPNPFIFAGSDFDNLDVTGFNTTLLLRFSLPKETPRSPSISFNQTNPAVSFADPSSESTNQPSDRPDLSADIGKPRTQELEKTHSIVTPEIVVIAPPQVLDGSGGIHSFTLTTGSYEVRNFGGVGTNRNPSDDIIREVDTLYFQGPQLIAKNLLLDQQGNDLTLTFADVQNISIILKDFNLENLDNFLTISETPLMLGNIVFNGETTSIQDSFDVIDANLIIAQVFNRNSVTFLNDSDNDVMGFDDSNDVINSQGGNDFLKGLGGDDILRGGASDDILWGGTGADILDGGTGNNWLTGGAGADVFRLCRNGLSQVIDFQVGEDRIGLPADIQIDQVAIEPGTELNSSTLIRFKPDGSLLMSLSGVTASSLTTDIFLPNASSLIRD
ncbi:calcium-binding protein [Phormidesmis priestleyi]|nr:calcium-binding protein [Phormidesmis priestleyi]